MDNYYIIIIWYPFYSMLKYLVLHYGDYFVSICKNFKDIYIYITLNLKIPEWYWITNPLENSMDSEKYWSKA